MKILSSANFATLNNEETIFFSRMEDLSIVFDKINQKDHDVILITGCGDRSADNFCAPDNVKYWFAQNALCNDERIIPIPIGICNAFEQPIPQQGSAYCGGSYDYCDQLSQLLLDVNLNDQTTPKEFMYANFTIETNQPYRSAIRDIALETDYINYEGPQDVGFVSGVGKYLSEDGPKKYVEKILNHEAVLCPIGAGVDTHRLWEALYCKRIPVTINSNSFRHERVNQEPHYPGEGWYMPLLPYEYAIYSKLYSQFPIVVLNSYRELFDKERLKRLIATQKEKEFDPQLLDFNYWENMILTLEKNL